jgi:hypothetical protein
VTGVEPAPVFTGGFSPMFQKILCNYVSIHCTILLAWEKNPLRENCRAPVGEEFSMNFGAADAALLTQGKENK